MIFWIIVFFAWLAIFTSHPILASLLAIIAIKMSVSR